MFSGIFFVLLLLLIRSTLTMTLLAMLEVNLLVNKDENYSSLNHFKFIVILTNKKSELLCYFIIFFVEETDHFEVNWWDNIF